MRRSEAAFPAMREAGIQPIAADFTRLQGVMVPAGWDWVVFSGAPEAGDEAAYRETYLRGARELVAWLGPTPPRAFVFTGSTAVYGQTDGSVVTEESPATPNTAGARVLVETERMLQGCAEAGFPVRMLRISGIYGPGRNRVAAFLRGEVALSAEGRRHMNMVHRDDVVSAIVAALERGRDGGVYNVSDSTPVTEREFMEWLAAALRCPLPETRPRAPRGRARGVGDRRVSNERLRRELGWEPRYASFREGYEALIAEWRAALGATSPGPELVVPGAAGLGGSAPTDQWSSSSGRLYSSS